MNLLVELEVLEAIPKQGSISSKDLAEIIKIDESAIGGISSTTFEGPIMTII
jgi:DNA-binding MarR family transcriptional regulator